jgi:RNA polymerase sigma factor (sigma-70 family)
MPPQDAEQARWFSEKVQPHEPMLRAWLRSRFPSECDIDDVIQQAYLRVLEARAKTAMQSPKAFLFAIARNLAVDLLRRHSIFRGESLAENDALSVLDTATPIPEAVGRAQEVEFLTQAIQSLPDRCRQIFTLRKIYGMSQKEIGSHLGISEHTVEAQVTIGMRKCAEFVRRHATIDPHNVEQRRAQHS